MAREHRKRPKKSPFPAPPFFRLFGYSAGGISPSYRRCRNSNATRSNSHCCLTCYNECLTKIMQSASSQQRPSETHLFWHHAPPKAQRKSATSGSDLAVARCELGCRGQKSVLSFAFGENKTALGVRIISDQVKRTILRPLSNTRERARRRRRRRRKRCPPQEKKR
jgi:hypothetical protein